MHRVSIRALAARKQFVAQFPFRQNLRFLRIHYSYIQKNNKALQALNCFSSKKNLKSRSIINNVCIFTGRVRGLTSVKLNRMQIRPFMEVGAIKGLKKFSW